MIIYWNAPEVYDAHYGLGFIQDWGVMGSVAAPVFTGNGQFFNFFYYG